MLVKELMRHLEKMDEESTVKMNITTKLVDNEASPTYASISTIEFDDNRVILKGNDELVEWE